jgi:hypothetical protein
MLLVMRVYVLFAAWQWVQFAASEEEENYDQPAMNIVNWAGSPIQLFWLDPDNGEESQMLARPVQNGSTSFLNSFDGHEFVIRLEEDPNVHYKFTKGPKHELAFVTGSATELLVTMQVVASYGMLMDWSARNEDRYLSPRWIRELEPKKRVEFAVNECAALKDNAKDFNRCFVEVAADDFEVLMRKKDSSVKSRDVMSSRLRNYTCADDSLQTTLPLYSKTVNIIDGTYKMDVLMDLPRSKIWTVHNFVSEEECGVLKSVSGPQLARATVADEDGAAIVSDNRKAQQARYKGVNDDGFFASDPLFPLYQKIFNITNEFASYQLHTDGQEGFMLIQYNKEDQYTPHCDGDCDDNQHVTGGRVATCVLYCEAPTRGGATTFTKADIFVKPVKGMATFFTYKGPEGLMDPGHTEHSGCPVLEGEKWIATVWMREGVSLERPQTLFDPSGGLLAMDELDV